MLFAVKWRVCLLCCLPLGGGFVYYVICRYVVGVFIMLFAVRWWVCLLCCLPLGGGCVYYVVSIVLDNHDLEDTKRVM